MKNSKSTLNDNDLNNISGGSHVRDGVKSLANCDIDNGYCLSYSGLKNNNERACINCHHFLSDADGIFCTKNHNPNLFHNK